jgi:hypothetical protein
VKKIDVILLFLIGLITASLLFFSRQIFFFRYDPEYFENYYYNSQWNVPQSTRGISDGELYKFVGYRLAEGENPFNINYEVPPFAKHLYGLAEKTIGNPYWISLGFYLLTGLGVYFLAWEFFKNRTTSLLGVLLFVSTPFVGTQIKETMLDLPLTALFFGNALFLVRYFKRSKTADMLLAGIFLGLATGTKIGVYTPLTLLLGLVLVAFSSRKIKSTFLYLISAGAGYVLSFSSYFLHHPNPIPWLRLHEKPLGFYLDSTGGNVDYLNQWKGIFLNTYRGFWVGASGGGLGDWSLVLPIGVIMCLTLLVIGLKKKDYSWIYLTLFSLGVLAVNTLIPFWPRYIMPLIPLFIVFILFAFRKFTPLILILAFLNLTILLPTLTVRNLPGHSEAVSRFLNTRAYRELFRSIDQESRTKYPEDKFQSAMENFYVTLRVKKIDISITDVIDTDTIHRGKINTRYQTDFGELWNSQDVDFVIEHNQWKTVWKWDYLWPGYDPEGKIEFKEITSKLIQKSEKAVYVIPRLMYDWGKYSSSLSTLTKMSNSEVDKKIRETIPDDFFRFVGYLDPDVDQDTIRKNLLPGIEIRDEKSFSSGTIIFFDTKGNRTSRPIKQY